MSKTVRSLRRRFVVLTGLLLVAVAALYGIDVVLGSGSMMGGGDWPAQFRSNGERIYFTGTSDSGLPIRPAGGGMHLRMHGGGCATCHGADRRGGRVMPRFWKAVPALTAAALFGEAAGAGHGDAEAGDGQAGDEHGESAEGGGHGDHEAYDDATLRRAITEGLDPAGERLDPDMPRWSIAGPDLADLIAFLKSPPRDAR
jgi:hypothetical protein